jgi:SET domain-containing protein 6
MMWEESRGAASTWGGYLANMPREFDSPMFWSAEDREGLKGTDIEGE